MKWIKRRYVENIPTVELINTAESEMEVEAISLVGLIDVKEDVLLKAMSEVEKSKNHILECRESALNLLKKIKKE
jgi:predicted urease superfamily metal-dependent hydrolase